MGMEKHNMLYIWTSGNHNRLWIENFCKINKKILLPPDGLLVVKGFFFLFVGFFPN